MEKMSNSQRKLIESMNMFCSKKFDLSYERTREEAKEYIRENITEYKCKLIMFCNF